MLNRILPTLFSREASAFAGRFQASLRSIARAWLFVALVLVMLKVVTGQGHSSPLHLLLLAGALALPSLALLGILRILPTAGLYAQPGIRLARLGRWRQLNGLDCVSLDAYGAAGLLSMLLVGLLLNIPVRAFEFVTAMPTPIPHAPLWYLTLYGLMLADLALLSTAYATLVGLAVRRVPYFPRLLAGTWLLDLSAQFAIGGIMGAVQHVPGAVQVSLSALLSGNVQKVAISIVIWMPYLLLSRRVNLTFRHRIPAKYAHALARN